MPQHERRRSCTSCRAREHRQRGMTRCVSRSVRPPLDCMIAGSGSPASTQRCEVFLPGSRREGGEAASTPLSRLRLWKVPTTLWEAGHGLLLDDSASDLPSRSACGLADPGFMGGMAVGMEQAHRDCFDVKFRYRFCQTAGLFGIEFLPDQLHALGGTELSPGGTRGSAVSPGAGG